MPQLVQPHQKRHLKGLAHSLKPVVQVGQDGLNPGVIKAVEEALLDHELIKVRLSRPEDKKTVANQLAEKTQATLVGLVGHTVILYKTHPKQPSIQLPKSKG